MSRANDEKWYPKGANLTADLNQNDRALRRRARRCLASPLWPVLDCSVQQPME